MRRGHVGGGPDTGPILGKGFGLRCPRVSSPFALGRRCIGSRQRQNEGVILRGPDATVLVLPRVSCAACPCAAARHLRWCSACAAEGLVEHRGPHWAGELSLKGLHQRRCLRRRQHICIGLTGRARCPVRSEDGPRLRLQAQPLVDAVRARPSARKLSCAGALRFVLDRDPRAVQPLPIPGVLSKGGCLLRCKLPDRGNQLGNCWVDGAVVCCELDDVGESRQDRGRHRSIGGRFGCRNHLGA